MERLLINGTIYIVHDVTEYNGGIVPTGGEDLFEFLDEESTEEPVAVVSRSEPLGYTLPLFFPFGKSEPTPPTLKLQGVSSFKKINK